MVKLTKHKVCKGSTTGFRGRNQRFHPYSIRGSRGISTLLKAIMVSFFFFNQVSIIPMRPSPRGKAGNLKPHGNWYVDLLRDEITQVYYKYYKGESSRVFEAVRGCARLPKPPQGAALMSVRECRTRISQIA